MRNSSDFVPRTATLEKTDEGSSAFSLMHIGCSRAHSSAAGGSVRMSVQKSSQRNVLFSNPGLNAIPADTGISQNSTRIITPRQTPEMRKQLFSCRARKSHFASISPEKQAWMGIGMKSVYLFRYLIGLTDFKVCLGRAEIPAGSGTFMCEGTKRKCFTTLRNIKAISWTRRIRIGAWQGIEFGIDESMKNAFLDLYGEFENSPFCLPDCHSEYQSGGTERKIKDKESSFLLTAYDLLKHPELGFWVDQGLNANKIFQWVEEFGIDLETMGRYLKWAAFDISRRDRDGSIRNAMNWFYKSLQSSGFYQKPEGYVSLEEKKRQTIEAIRRENAELQRRLEEEERLERELEIKKEIEAIIQEGESNELYAEAVKGLPAFASGVIRPALVRHYVRQNLQKRFGVEDRIEQWS